MRIPYSDFSRYSSKKNNDILVRFINSDRWNVGIISFARRETASLVNSFSWERNLFYLQKEVYCVTATEIRFTFI